MTFDEQLRQAFDRAIADTRGQLDLSLSTLAQEVARAAAEERQQMTLQADAQIAAVRQQAEAQATAMRQHAETHAADVRQQADTQVGEVRRQAEAQVGEVRRQADAQVAEVRRHAEAQVAELKEQARRQFEELRHSAAAQVADLRRGLDEMRVATQQQIEAVRRTANAEAEDLVVSQLAAAAADNDRRTREEVASARAEAEGAALAGALRLVESVRALDEARALGELLDYLAQCASREVERAALFVVKGERLQGWRLAGFGTEAPPAKMLDLAMDEVAPPAFARTAEARDFATLPLEVGGAVVAVLYADTTAGRSDIRRWRAVLEVLTRHADRALEALTVSQATGLMLPRPMARASHSPPGQAEAGPVQ